MPDQGSKKDTAEALRRGDAAGDGRKKTPVPDPAAPAAGTDDETEGTANSPKQASTAREGEIHAVGPGPGVIPPEMAKPAGPDKTAPEKRETVFPTDLPPARPPDSGRPMRWVIGAFVAALALWLLVRMFG
ncbi:hypothetical protein [Roseinatronobacter sp. S2]|uniref:hypothetical protein n=1 Tax=Roseinatronobacter sp. S2 TaxID=3035471 RepID=UPI00240FF4D5|nr:hypothetical protein [Roseinatronobacter sp. S2]WFE76568.1 hypothetical protein P8S53_18795 [Roseinatronobacter sp. S2]